MWVSIVEYIDLARQFINSHVEIATLLSTVVGALVGYYFRDRSEKTRLRRQKEAAVLYLLSQLQNAIQHYQWTLEEIPDLLTADDVAISIRLDRGKLLGIGVFEVQPAEWVHFDHAVQQKALRLLLFVRNNDLYADTIGRILPIDRSRASRELDQLRERMQRAIFLSEELAAKLAIR